MELSSRRTFYPGQRRLPTGRLGMDRGPRPCSQRQCSSTLIKWSYLWWHHGVSVASGWRSGLFGGLVGPGLALWGLSSLLRPGVQAWAGGGHSTCSEEKDSQVQIKGNKRRGELRAGRAFGDIGTQAPEEERS